MKDQNQNPNITLAALMGTLAASNEIWFSHTSEVLYQRSSPIQLYNLVAGPKLLNKQHTQEIKTLVSFGTLFSGVPYTDLCAFEADLLISWGLPNNHYQAFCCLGCGEAVLVGNGSFLFDTDFFSTNNRLNAIFEAYFPASAHPKREW